MANQTPNNPSQTQTDKDRKSGTDQQQQGEKQGGKQGGQQGGQQGGGSPSDRQPGSGGMNRDR